MKGNEINEIYPYKLKEYSAQQDLLAKESTSQSNKELIQRFMQNLLAKGRSKKRVTKLMPQIRNIAVFLGKDLDAVEKTDLERAVVHYNQAEQYSEATRKDYCRCIKQFYIWLEDEDKRMDSEDRIVRNNALKLYKFVKKDIKTTYKLPTIDFKRVLTDEDINLVLEKGCKTHMEKALIKTLHESGLRVGEFLNLKIGDVIFKENHAILRVNVSKTFGRDIPILASIPYLMNFLDVHPTKNDKDSFIWIGQRTNLKNHALQHKGIEKLIARCFKASGLNKKHNCHWFRHSRASLNAPHYAEVMMCQFFGWQLGSKQVRVYCHLSKSQLETSFKELNGIKSKDEQMSKPVKCLCGRFNSSDARYCSQCRRPLSIKTVIEDKEGFDAEMNKSIKLLFEIAQNPDLMKQFEEFKAKAKTGYT